MKKITIIFIVAVLLLTTGGFYYYYSIINFKGKEQIQILEDPNIKSFKQVLELEELKRKVVYIDVWGTLCGPCIKEFNFSSDLKNRFINEPVAFLYLASPYGRPDDNFRWKKMIQEKKLNGIHMLLTIEAYDDIWETLKDSINTLYQIPHYMIIGKNGKILIANANRPSSKEKLYAQIEDVLKNY